MATVLHVTLNSGNEAFADNYGAEVARILRELAYKVENSSDGSGTLRDHNGNRVGNWSLSVED